MNSPFGNVQISYDGFLRNLTPLYDGILTFSDILSPYDVFNQLLLPKGGQYRITFFVPVPAGTFNKSTGTGLLLLLQNRYFLPVLLLFYLWQH